LSYTANACSAIAEISIDDKDAQLIMKTSGFGLFSKRSNERKEEEI